MVGVTLVLLQLTIRPEEPLRHTLIYISPAFLAALIGVPAYFVGRTPQYLRAAVLLVTALTALGFGMVLNVEDDAAGADVLISHFRRLRIGYTSLYDSRQTVEVALGLPNLRIIFVDLEMPGVDGYAALEAIRAEPRLSHIPVVAYTAHLSEIANARATGFHSFIGKPIRAAEFPAQLDTILNDTPVWSIR